MKLLYLLTVLSIGIASFVHAEDNSYQIHQQSAISSAAGTPWSAARHLELVQKANGLYYIPQILFYPLSEEALQTIYQADTISFFAYGSMIDRDSGAVRAISSQAAATQIPAIAFGIQRTFNREMAPTAVGDALKRPNDLAVLNIFHKTDAVLNGVLFQLPASDLISLSNREVGYDLIPVVVMRWDDAVDEQKEPEVFLAYTFKAPDYQGEGVRYTNPHINPNPAYFHYLQKGLNHFGDDFKAMWWATTYLADRTTRVNELPYRLIDLK